MKKYIFSFLFYLLSSLSLLAAGGDITWTTYTGTMEGVDWYYDKPTITLRRAYHPYGTGVITDDINFNGYIQNSGEVAQDLMIDNAGYQLQPGECVPAGIWRISYRSDWMGIGYNIVYEDVGEYAGGGIEAIELDFKRVTHYVESTLFVNPQLCNYKTEFSYQNSSPQNLLAVVVYQYENGSTVENNTGLVIPAADSIFEPNEGEYTYIESIPDNYPSFAYVRLYMGGAVVAESEMLAFTADDSTLTEWTSAPHFVTYHEVPDPRYTVAVSAYNGFDSSGSVKAAIYGSGGYAEIIDLGTIAAGDYYSPVYQLFQDYGDLPDDVVPEFVEFYIIIDGSKVASSTYSFDLTDRNIYAASGFVNGSGVNADPDNPVPPDPDSADPANPDPLVDSGGDPFDPDNSNPDDSSSPPVPAPLPNGTNAVAGSIDYEKLTQSVEFAFENQGLSRAASNLNATVDSDLLGAEFESLYSDKYTELETGLSEAFNPVTELVDGMKSNFSAPDWQRSSTIDLTHFTINLTPYLSVINSFRLFVLVFLQYRACIGALRLLERAVKGAML